MQPQALGVKMHVCIFRLLNAFTPAARPDSNGYNFLICDPNSVILDSLERFKSLVSKGSSFTGFGLAV